MAELSPTLSEKNMKLFAFTKPHDFRVFNETSRLCTDKGFFPRALLKISHHDKDPNFQYCGSKIPSLDKGFPLQHRDHGIAWSIQ